MAAVYSMKVEPTFTVPFEGAVSMPTSATESPSGSIPVSGMGMRAVVPAMARALTVRGRGLALSSPTALTRRVTCAESSCPSGPRTA